MDWLKMLEWLKRRYCEVPDSPLAASDFEVIVFCLSFISFAVFIVVVELWCFAPKHLFILFPAPFWIFLRASRKNMTATGNMIAGSIGAIGGALFVILAWIIKTNL